MNLHEKTEKQYKVVEMFNSINDTTELFISELDDLLEEFKNGERNSISVVNEMKEVIEHIRVSEYEKNTLCKVIKSIGEEKTC